VCVDGQERRKRWYVGLLPPEACASSAQVEGQAGFKAGFKGGGEQPSFLLKARRAL
jgi:hypothetical protein